MNLTFHREKIQLWCFYLVLLSKIYWKKAKSRFKTSASTISKISKKCKVFNSHNLNTTFHMYSLIKLARASALKLRHTKYLSELAGRDEFGLIIPTESRLYLLIVRVVEVGKLTTFKTQIHQKQKSNTEWRENVEGFGNKMPMRS